MSFLKYLGGAVAGVAMATALVVLSSGQPVDPVGQAGADYTTSGHAMDIVSGDGSPVTVIITRGDVVVTAGGDPEGPAETEPESATVAADTTDTAALPEISPILEHEGYRETPYELGGHRHVCYGDLDSGAVQMTPRECLDRFKVDLSRAMDAALAFVGADHWRIIGPKRQGAVINMAYLLGGQGLEKFRGLRLALRESRWADAGVAILDSCLNPGNAEHARCAGKTPIQQSRVDWLVESFQ